MGQQEKVATSLAGAVGEEISASLAPVDAELERRYPGDPGTRQPVHTVYVPGDVFAADTVRTWGDRALVALDEHAPDAASFAAVLGLADDLAEPVYSRVRAKLEREPIEDLRVDFEDGYGNRSDAEEDEAAARAARLIAEAYEQGTAAPYMGIRMKCMEAPVRARGIRTLDVFLSGLMEAGGLPDGLVLTLPKVTYPEQVTAMVRLLEAFEKARGLEPGRIGFEIQIETSQSILAADGTAAVARMIQAAEGRATGLHYGTFDYSACLGVSAAYQASDHPAADHAKAVMQVAAAGTGVRVSDGSTNVLPVGPTEKVHDAWRLHFGLTRRALARAYYQGWDMHPGHIPTRYAAVFAFYREGFEQAAARLARYANRTGGDVMDEPATAKALSGYLLRGLDCGALDIGEVARLTGLTRADLEGFSARGAATSRHRRSRRRQRVVRRPAGAHVPLQAGRRHPLLLSEQPRSPLAQPPVGPRPRAELLGRRPEQLPQPGRPAQQVGDERTLRTRMPPRGTGAVAQHAVAVDVGVRAAQHRAVARLDAYVGGGEPGAVEVAGRHRHPSLASITASCSASSHSRNSSRTVPGALTGEADT